MIFLQSVGQVFMEKTVSLTAMKTVTCLDVTDSQGTVTEGVNLDGRTQLVIKVSEWACFLLIIIFSLRMQYVLYLEKHIKNYIWFYNLCYFFYSLIQVSIGGKWF